MKDPPSPSSQVDGLTVAALEFDQRTATAIMTRALRTRGVVDAWTEVIAPALHRRGEQFGRTADGVAAEHLLSECTRGVLSAVIWRRRRWTRNPPVLLAAPDGEQHTLPLQALAAALAEVHRPSVLLGASVPPRALLDAAARLGPMVIFLWSQSPLTARNAELATLRPAVDPCTIVLGGPGWPRTDAGHVATLAAALHACTRPTLPVRRDPGAASPDDGVSESA